MTQLTFSLNFYWKICFKFCILEQIIATVLFICISSINNKRMLLRFQSTTAPTNRSACDRSNFTSLVYFADGTARSHVRYFGGWSRFILIQVSIATKGTEICHLGLWKGPKRLTRQMNFLKQNWIQGWHYDKGLIYYKPIFRLTAPKSWIWNLRKWLIIKCNCKY